VGDFGNGGAEGAWFAGRWELQGDLKRKGTGTPAASRENHEPMKVEAGGVRLVSPTLGAKVLAPLPGVEHSPQRALSNQDPDGLSTGSKRAAGDRVGAESAKADKVHMCAAVCGGKFQLPGQLEALKSGRAQMGKRTLEQGQIMTSARGTQAALVLEGELPRQQCAGLKRGGVNCGGDCVLRFVRELAPEKKSLRRV
jgi:hypothetical protein